MASVLARLCQMSASVLRVLLCYGLISMIMTHVHLLMSPCLPAYGCVFVACLMACMLLVKLFMNYLCDHVFFKGPPGEDLELRHFLVLV